MAAPLSICETAVESFKAQQQVKLFCQNQGHAPANRSTLEHICWHAPGIPLFLPALHSVPHKSLISATLRFNWFKAGLNWQRSGCRSGLEAVSLERAHKQPINQQQQPICRRRLSTSTVGRSQGPAQAQHGYPAAGAHPSTPAARCAISDRCAPPQETRHGPRSSNTLVVVQPPERHGCKRTGAQQTRGWESRGRRSSTSCSKRRRLSLEPTPCNPFCSVWMRWCSIPGNPGAASHGVLAGHMCISNLCESG